MTIKLFWWRGAGETDTTKCNFGDYLSPKIVEMLSGKKVTFAPPETADMIAIGSILSRERKAKRFLLKRRLHIWGSGTDSVHRQFSGRHYYHAVRGFKTLDQIKNLNSLPALGDPGLLANLWWGERRRPTKKFRIGLVPHFIDHGDIRIRELLSMYDMHFINVLDPVDVVINEILQCDFILSSSMHGLIVADSFGIPNRRIVFSDGIISDLKFVDYYSVFHISEPSPLTATRMLSTEGVALVLENANSTYERRNIEEVKQGLVNAFPAVI